MENKSKAAALGEFSAAVEDAGTALSRLHAHALRVQPRISGPIALFEDLIRQAAKADVPSERLDHARAAGGALAADLRTLASLHDEMIERVEALIHAAAAARNS